MSDSLESIKRRILNAVSLKDLVGARLRLTQKGQRYWGCCPFHEEKTPSFTIIDDKRYYCFGCKASGDVIEFVRKMEGMSFHDALRHLAPKAGVDATEIDNLGKGFRDRIGQAPLFKLMVESQEFFRQGLKEPRAEATRQYLRERGFSDENIEAFGFGLTPPESYGLVRHLRGRGHKERDMLSCGLATSGTQDHRIFDFFKARLMIPIHDAQGRVIAFGGRTIENHRAKYMNSRDTPLFDKSRVLFGFHKARSSMRPRGRAVVVEGYMDALQLWQQGFPETVACLGTALTEPHLKMLRFATSDVTLLFDGDAAGRKATLGAVSIALAVPELRVRAVALPDKMDPDDFVRKNGAEALETILDQAVDLLDFAVRERIKETHQLGIPQLLKEEILPWLAKTPDVLMRGILIRRIAELTGLNAGDIERQLAPARPVAKRPEPRQAVPPLSTGPSAARPAEPLDRRTEELFGQIFHARHEDLDVSRLRHHLERRLDLDDAHKLFLKEMLDVLEDGRSPAALEEREWISSLEPTVALLLHRLKGAAKAYETQSSTSRMALIARLMNLKAMATLQETSKSLKSELARVSATPGSEDEQRRILLEIVQIEREIQGLRVTEPSLPGPGT